MRGKSRKQAKRAFRKKRRKTRRQRGGAGCDKYKAQMLMLKHLIEKAKIPAISSQYVSFLLSPDIDLKECSEAHFPDLKEQLVGYPIQKLNALVTSFSKDTLNILFSKSFLENAPSGFYEFFGFGQNQAKRDCSVKELMELEANSAKTICKETSLARVRGSCGDPAFFSEDRDSSDEEKRNFIQLFTAIERKLLADSDPKYFDLVLGATDMGISDYFLDHEHSYTLLINPSYSKTFDDTLQFIEAADTLKRKSNQLRAYFPLRYFERPNTLAILDKLIEMKSNGINVRITNRMCGSCHPSLYYLVNHGIEYTVAPEQKVQRSNTDEIKRCFRPANISNRH